MPTAAHPLTRPPTHRCPPTDLQPADRLCLLHLLSHVQWCSSTASPACPSTPTRAWRSCALRTTRWVWLTKQPGSGRKAFQQSSMSGPVASGPVHSVQLRSSCTPCLPTRRTAARATRARRPLRRVAPLAQPPPLAPRARRLERPAAARPLAPPAARRLEPAPRHSEPPLVSMLFRGNSGQCGLLCVCRYSLPL